jgi:site-specific recombinase XerD
LHHISKSAPAARRVVGLKVPRKLPRILSVAGVQAILNAYDRLRDRLLFAVLYVTGMRIGEALGLRHEDWAAAERTVAVVPRINDNGARVKSVAPWTIPVSAGLVRLYADYLHGEYGDLDSDYVFVNLWGEPRGHPLAYAAVYDLVKRLRRRTGIDFDPHWCRHTYATGLLRAGTPVEVVSTLLGHASVTTTIEVCGHLSVADARRVLEQAPLVHRQRGAAVSVPSPGRVPDPRRPGLLQRLLGTVRPEFRADVLVFPADDPVFGDGACRVAGCGRSARGHGLCPGHHLRWLGEDRPDLAASAASTDPRWRRQRPNAACRITGCGSGVARGGLCQLHYHRWDRAGQPDPDDWTAGWAAIRPPAPGAACRIDHCELWPQAALPFCHSHANTWRVNGQPAVEVFVRRFAEVATTEEKIIRLGRLGRQLKLEIQYALQCRRDQPGTKTLPAVVMALVRALDATGVVSLLDLAEDQCRTQVNQHNARALLFYARLPAADLADAGGWEAEFGRDVWEMRRLGFDGNQRLTFTGIAQPWLRDLVKRWLRWRLGTGLGLPVASRGLLALTRFAVFCQRIGVTALAGIDRTVLERYLADLHAELADRQRHGDHIGQLNSFLQAVRQHHWDDALPATALMFSDDYPPRAERPPRALAEQVMAQIEDPANLAPVRQPGLSAGHPDPDPRRFACHRRAEPAAGLPGHRRRRRALPAL